jgi:2,4-dienoyl-CoA reductase-like NADH-dependent reductase (Old Yellow Enzyme family)
MSKLFEPGKINGMVIANRFVRSATWEAMATDDGACTPQLIDLMAGLAKGGVGLIITGHSYISKEGQAGPRQLGVYKDELIPGLAEMTRVVHDRGGKIAMQLAHAGFNAKSKHTGQTPFAPSMVKGLSKSPQREMSLTDIRQVVRAFAQASQRAKTAGFDAVQIHSAHGYLLSQFLSPIYNKRTDMYGGDIHNRARALIEILQAIRKETGPDYPVLVKLNTQDFAENGLSLADSVRVGVMLNENGIDAIELSGGIYINGKFGAILRTGIKSETDEAYFSDGAMAFKEKVHIPLLLVGGIRSFQVAESLVVRGVADYISMSRPFIREPNLINRWRSGDLKKARCVSDNRCFEPIKEGGGVRCVREMK